MDDQTRQYTPSQYVGDLKALIEKAIESGAPPEGVAQLTMDTAHAYWDECYGPGGADEIVTKIKKSHSTWDNIGDNLTKWGFDTNTN